MASLVRSLLKSPTLVFAVLAAAASLNDFTSSADSSSASSLNVVTPVQGRLLLRNGNEREDEKQFRICLQKCLPESDLDDLVAEARPHKPGKIYGGNTKLFKEAFQKVIDKNGWKNFHSVTHKEQLRNVFDRIDSTQSTHLAPEDDEVTNKRHCWKKPFPAERAKIQELEADVERKEGQGELEAALSQAETWMNSVNAAWADAPDADPEMLNEKRAVQDRTAAIEKKMFDKNLVELNEKVKAKNAESTKQSEQGNFEESYKIAEESEEILKTELKKYVDSQKMHKSITAMLSEAQTFRTDIRKLQRDQERRNYYHDMDRYRTTGYKGDKENSISNVRALKANIETFIQGHESAPENVELLQTVKQLEADLKQQKIDYDSDEEEERTRKGFRSRLFAIRRLKHDNLAEAAAQAKDLYADVTSKIGESQKDDDRNVVADVFDFERELAKEFEVEEAKNLAAEKKKMRDDFKIQRLRIGDMATDTPQQLAEAHHEAEKLLKEAHKDLCEDDVGDVQLLSSLKQLQADLQEKKLQADLAAEQKLQADLKQIADLQMSGSKKERSAREFAFEKFARRASKSYRQRGDAIMRKKAADAKAQLNQARQERLSEYKFADESSCFDGQRVVFEEATEELESLKKNDSRFVDELRSIPEYWTGKITNAIKVKYSTDPDFDAKKQATEILNALELTPEEVEMRAENQEKKFREFIEGPEIGRAVNVAVEEWLKKN